MADENDFLDIEDLVQLPPSNGKQQTNQMQVFQQDKALIDMQIATAKSYPRDLKRAVSKAIELVTLDYATAKSCIYTLSKGGKKIVGPSVVLAKILAQKLGNIRVENRVVGYDQTHVTCEATCMDLENNFAIRTTIKKSIVGASGRYSEDMCVITGNAGNAIALRNAIFAVLDKQVVDKVYKAAQMAITGDVSDENKLIARRSKTIDGLLQSYKSMNLSIAEILKFLNKSSVDHINAEDIIVLAGVENAIANGEQNFDDVFRPQSKKFVPTPDSEIAEQQRLELLIKQAKTRKKLDELKPHISTNALRIVFDEAYKNVPEK